jgi:Flp pilus assembly protein TadD
MGYAAVSQSLYWADDLSLNFHAHEVAPQNVDAMASLGAAVAARGMDAAAVTLYKQALQVRPDLWRANVNLAYIYYQHGDFAEAVHYFERSCASDPTDGDQFFYLGLAALQINRTAEAEAAMRTALLVRPQGKGYHLGLGMVLKQKGKLLEAKKEIETDLADDPRNARARALLEEIGEQRQVQPKKPLSGWSRKTETSDAK